jgi:hypothetical protein
MHVKRVLPLLALLLVASFTLTPMVTATPPPYDSVLGWSHGDGIVQGSTITATFGFGVSGYCLTGYTFSGNLTVTEPDGVSVATVSVKDVPCGTTDLTAVYPTGFTGTAGTSELGTYTAVWRSDTSQFTSHIPIIAISQNFTVALTTNYVPEFGAPAILVAAMGLVLLALMKKTKMLKL